MTDQGAIETILTIWWTNFPDTEEDFKELSRQTLDELEKLGYRKIPELPKIICLCGSTRFTNEMLIKQWELTKQGYIVLGWCALPESYFIGSDNAHIGDQEGVKETVDEVHKRKIDIADELFILNVGGYIGESTANEIAYANRLGKPIKYLESPA